jgi:diguanylate cyclase (GGDEF)-like protein
MKPPALLSPRQPPVARRLLGAALALGAFDLALLAWRLVLDDPAHPWVVPLRVVSTLVTLALVGVALLALRRFVQAQAARHEQTERERMLFDALPIGLLLWDADDRFVLCNADFRALYPALAPQLAPGLRFEDLLHHALAAGLVPQAAGREQAWLAERLAQHRTPGAAIVRRMPDGRWRRIVEQRLPDGSLLSYSIDITELERQRLELEQARADAERARRTLHDAVQALPAGFELYDADDRLVMVNDVMRQMYPRIADLWDRGLRFEELVCANHARGGLPATPQPFEDWLAERLRQRRSGGAPRVHQLAEGRWVRTYERPLPQGGLVGVRIDVTELQRLNSELGRLSETEALTGLANRRLFDQRLAEELVRARRDGTPLALAIVDVDHFKRYNDRHGHPAGDACLQQVAAVLRGTARRPSDLAARLGGEEFALLLPQDAAAAAALGERCIAALDHAALPHGDSPVAPQVTISVGVAELAALGALPHEGDASALLRAADRALYAAKQAGRHRVAAAPAHRGAD